MLLNFSSEANETPQDELLELMKSSHGTTQHTENVASVTESASKSSVVKPSIKAPKPKQAAKKALKKPKADNEKRMDKEEMDEEDEHESEDDKKMSEDEEEGSDSDQDISGESSEEESASEVENDDEDGSSDGSDSEEESKKEASASFESLGLGPQLLTHLTSPKTEGRGGGMGLVAPKLVQIKAIPVLLQGKDVIVKSQTGSGKTLAFLLPVVDNLSQRERKVSRTDGLYGIFLSPTRELCFQIVDVLEELLRPFHWIISTTLVGGEKKKSEKARLRKGTNLLVATPGRLLDHLRTTVVLEQQLSRRKLRWLVLDEADRLMDAGFAQQMGEVLDLIQVYSQSGAPDLGKDMQTVLISATISPGIKALSGRSLRDPVLIACDTPRAPKSAARAENAEPVLETADGKFSTPKHLSQHYLTVPATQRLVTLAAFIRRHVRLSGHTAKLIVFVSCRAMVDFLHAVLSEVVWPPPPRAPKNRKRPEPEAPKDVRTVGLGTRWWKLHGSVAQVNRRAAVKEFRKAKGGVLLCTDVAARGLDLPSVDWVVQFEAPSEIAEYVHRVGRTARNGRRGAAVIFLRPNELEFVSILRGRGLVLEEQRLDSVISSLLSGGSTVGSAKQGKARRGALTDPDAAASLLQIRLEDLVQGGPGKGLSQAMAKLGGHRAQREEPPEEEEAGRLLQLAQDAYLSALRAYAVHSKGTKHIFQPKALHLGHEARGFALREQPKGISSTAKRKAREERQDQRRVESKKRFRSGAQRVGQQGEGDHRRQRGGGHGGRGGGRGGASSRFRPGKDRRERQASSKKTKRAPLVVSEFGS